uniref:Uncharacterized protein n=1 Tax=Strongyloides papillosus TaxID=174720 RepID=A0A0N5C931_STREA
MTTSEKLMELMAEMEVPPIVSSLKRDAKGYLDLNNLLETIKTILPENDATTFKAITMMLAKEYADLKTSSMDSDKIANEENENIFTSEKLSQLLIETIKTVSENSVQATSSIGNLNISKSRLPPLPILQQNENPITFIEKFKNRFAGLTEQECIALFPEFLEGHALIAYKAIETEKMVTFEEILKEWVSRYDPNMTPQRRLIKLEQILVTAAPFTKDTPNIYINKIAAWIRELEKLKEKPLSYKSKMKYILLAVRHLERYQELTEKYIEAEDTYEAYLKFQKMVLSALTKEMEAQLRTQTKTEAQKQREKLKNSDKFNSRNSVFINESNSEIN